MGVLGDRYQEQIKTARSPSGSDSPGHRSVTLDDQTTLLLFNGYIDSYTSGLFRQAIQDALAAGARNVICDMQEIAYLGSAGAGIFIECTGQLQSTGGGGLALVNPSEKVMEVFVLLGIQTLFEVIKL